MNRLTEKITIGKKTGNILNCSNCPKKSICKNDKNYRNICLRVAIDRLAELEDKIENGTLVELPCKVGDKVWVLERNNNLIKMEIVEYSLSEKLKRYYAVSVIEGYGYWIYESELNEDWFLTKAEAEKKLKELKGE